MGKIKLPHIYFGVLCDAFKVVETVGLVRPQCGGKRGFPRATSFRHYALFLLLRRLAETDKINMGKIKLPHIYFGVLCDAFKVVETVGLEPTTSCM